MTKAPLLALTALCALAAAEPATARLPWVPRRLGGGASSCDQDCSKGSSRCGCGDGTQGCSSCASCCDIATDTCVCVDSCGSKKAVCKREFGTHAFKPHRVSVAGKIPSQLASAAITQLKMQAAKAVPAQELISHKVVATLMGKKEEEVTEVAEQNVLGLFNIPVRVRAEEAGSEYYISLMTAYTPTYSTRRSTHANPAWELHLVKAFEDPRTGKAQLTVVHPKHTVPAANDPGLLAATKFAAARQCVSGRCSSPSRVVANVQRVSYADLTSVGSRASKSPWAQQDLTACYTIGYVMADGALQSTGRGGRQLAVETQFEAVVCMQEGDYDALTLVEEFSPRAPEMRLVAPNTVAVGSGFGDRQFVQMCQACSAVNARQGGSSIPQVGGGGVETAQLARLAEPSRSGGARYGSGAAASGGTPSSGANSFTWMLVLGTLGIIAVVYQSEVQARQQQRGGSGPSYAQVQGDAEPTMMPTIPSSSEGSAGAYGST